MVSPVGPKFRKLIVRPPSSPHMPAPGLSMLGSRSIHARPGLPSRRAHLNWPQRTRSHLQPVTPPGRFAVVHRPGSRRKSLLSPLVCVFRAQLRLGQSQSFTRVRAHVLCPARHRVVLPSLQPPPKENGKANAQAWHVASVVERKTGWHMQGPRLHPRSTWPHNNFKTKKQNQISSSVSRTASED